MVESIAHTGYALTIKAHHEMDKNVQKIHTRKFSEE